MKPNTYLVLYAFGLSHSILYDGEEGSEGQSLPDEKNPAKTVSILYFSLKPAKIYFCIFNNLFII